MPPTQFGFGQALARKEDDAFVRGAGRYVADHAPAGALHAVVLRSPHAHARFRITDVAKAKGMPGVALVLTGEDTAELGDLPCQGAIPESELVVPPYPLLARNEVRHVGDAVAVVVADTVDRARDAAEALAVEWDALPHVIGAAAALQPGAPPVWPATMARRGNLAFETHLGDAKATAHAFARAARTVSLTLVNQRLVTNYLDTRGVVAEYDGERTTLTLSSQGSHTIRDAVRRHIQDRDRKDSGRDPRCRWRLRHETLSLPRIRACRFGGAAHGAAGEMDRRPQRALPRRRAGSR